MLISNGLPANIDRLYGILLTLKATHSRRPAPVGKNSRKCFPSGGGDLAEKTRKKISARVQGTPWDEAVIMHGEVYCKNKYGMYMIVG